MNFFRPRCARTCPEAYAGIVHACLRSNPRARPSAHVVHSHLWKMSMSTSKAVPDAHPPIKFPLVRWVEDEVAWRFHMSRERPGTILMAPRRRFSALRVMPARGFSRENSRVRIYCKR